MRGRVTPQIAVANAITTSPIHFLIIILSLGKASGRHRKLGPFVGVCLGRFMQTDEKILMTVMTDSNAQEWVLILQ